MATQMTGTLFDLDPRPPAPPAPPRWPSTQKEWDALHASMPAEHWAAVWADQESETLPEEPLSPEDEEMYA